MKKEYKELRESAINTINQLSKKLSVETSLSEQKLILVGLSKSIRTLSDISEEMTKHKINSKFLRDDIGTYKSKFKLKGNEE